MQDQVRHDGLPDFYRNAAWLVGKTATIQCDGKEEVAQEGKKRDRDRAVPKSRGGKRAMGQRNKACIPPWQFLVLK
jgi:hypothetical protein